MPTPKTWLLPIASALFGFAVSATLASAQAPAAPASPQTPAAQAPGSPQAPQAPDSARPAPAPTAGQAQGPQARTSRGELSAVDATKKELTVKPAEGAEMKFTYTDTTRVTGGSGGVAGLSTMNGREVVVTYTMQGTNRIATEIAIQPAAAR